MVQWLFDIIFLVQEELTWRRPVHSTENGKRRCYSCNHCFAQLLFSGDCCEFFRRVHWNNRGCKTIVWRCCSRLEATGYDCHARTVNEDLLKEVVNKTINQVLCKKDNFMLTLQSNIATVVKAGDALSPEIIDEQLRELQKELVKKADQRADYDANDDEILRFGTLGNWSRPTAKSNMSRCARSKTCRISSRASTSRSQSLTRR